MEIDLIIGGFPQPKWGFKLGDVTFTTSTAPNRFHRWMQRKLLGIVWEEL